MKTKIIEVTDMALYGKFLLGRFDSEWCRRALIDRTIPEDAHREVSLLLQEGWGPEHILVLDISHPSYGSIFLPGGDPAADLKRRGLTGLV